MSHSPCLLLAILLTSILHPLDGLLGVQHDATLHSHAVATIASDSEVTIGTFSSAPAAEVQINSHVPETDQAAVASDLQSTKLLHLSDSTSRSDMRYAMTGIEVRYLTTGLGFISLAGLLGAAFAWLAGKVADAREQVVEGKGAEIDSDKPLEVTNISKQLPRQASPGSDPAQPHALKVIFFVVGHSASASLLTISNKFAMVQFHPPATTAGSANASYMWTLVSIQFLVAAFVAFLAGASGLCSVTPFQLRKALAFFPAASMFMITIVAGNAVMNFANVNAFLVLRSLVPLPCTMAETWVYNDARPPLLSGLALLVTVGGAAGYGTAIGGLEIQSISWAVMYLVLMPVDAILIKHSISSLNITPWGLVLYNNLLAALPAVLSAFLFEVPNMESFLTMCKVLVSKEAFGAVLISCLLGISISYFQLRTRYFISATAFMVLGVVNKFMTVLLNDILNQQQGLAANACVLITISGAILWQLSVRSNSIRVREGNASLERSFVLPFALACAALMWAGYVEWHQVVGMS